MVQQGMVGLLRGVSKGRRCCSPSAQKGALPPSIYSLSRAFSSKLFVGGLSYHTNEEMLRKAFAEHGDVVDVKIVTDRETGRSRGFGFITFSSEADAEAAKAKMSNHLLDGRFIRVDLASNRPPQSPTSPRPFGNSSTSPSGFSFGTPGTRPPSVQDWGPLPSYSTNTTQTNSWGSSSSINTSSQGVLDGGMPSSSLTSSNRGSGSSSSSNTSALQSSTTASEFQRSSSDNGSSSSAVSVTAQERASSTAPWAASTQGIVANDSTSVNMSSFQMGTEQSPACQVSLDLVETSVQIGSSKHSSNDNTVSQSGLRSDMESGVSSTSTTAPSGSSTKHGFRSFPDLTSNEYKDYKPPGELQEPKSGINLPSKNLAPRRSETWQPKLTEVAIPPPKGPVYNFGLAGIPDAPPPLDNGANPQGGFNLSVCLDELPEAEPVRLPYSIFTARTLPPLDLPYLTPEADNWSEIGKPPRRIEDSPYSPFGPDFKDDPEFWWDPYDFDPEAKLLKEAFAEEPTEESKMSKESEPVGTKASEAEDTKISKEPEAEESPVLNAAVS